MMSVIFLYGGIVIILQLTFLSISAPTDSDYEDDDRSCKDIKCSDVRDYVCGQAVLILNRRNITVVRTYINRCHMEIVRCHLRNLAVVEETEDSKCGIVRFESSIFSNLYNGRRMADFSIVGAHQACNHTCPTYCVDTYEPACARIWTSPDSFKYRPMINHCHIDLLSCAAGVNVTVEPLGKCYKNPSGLMFMSQIAAMKSLQLIHEHEAPNPVTNAGRFLPARVTKKG